jgi:molybdopterin-guanine dinucleotide biosynthesis protein B
MAPDDPAIIAIASDLSLPDVKVPVVGLDDVDGIVDVLIGHALPRDLFLARSEQP